MNEEWKDVVGYEGMYQVSNFGRVKSLERKVNNGNGHRIVQEIIVRQNLTGPKGSKRYAVGLHKYRKQQTKTVHLLILEAFLGPRPEGLEACHNDGDALNNALLNLRWDTKESNEKDKIRHGTAPNGENHGMSKLTDVNVLEIREKYATGNYTYVELAEEYGVSFGMIGLIIRGDNWQHLLTDSSTLVKI